MLTQQRAEEIWAQRGIQNTLNDDLFTHEELKAVNDRWKQMCGSASFMSAFFTFLHPQTVGVRWSKPEEWKGGHAVQSN